MKFRKTPLGVNYLYDYYPVNWKEHGEDSQAILRFKDGYETEIERFAYEIKEALINKAGNDISIFEGAKLILVPSHRYGEWSESLLRVAQVICKELGMDNRSRALLRTTNHAKLSTGGERSVESHLRTIELKRAYAISGEFKGQRVLILDDITTTGNSIRACAQILRKAGVLEVEAVTIGQTARRT